MKSVLLIGGTGAIGQCTAAACLARGYRVTSTSRRRIRDSSSGINYIQGDGLDQKFIQDLIRNTKFDVIIDFMVYRTSKFLSVLPDFLKNTGRYVFLSSYRVYADTGYERITERSARLLDVTVDKKFLASDEYSLAKARQEDALGKAAGAGAENWTIVRPSITYSKNRLQFGCLEAKTFVPRVTEGLPVVIPKEMLQKYTTMTAANDAGRMIAGLVEHRSAMAEDFNIVNSSPITWREVSNLYTKEMGMDVREVSLSDYISLGINPYQVKYDRMFNRICDNQKVLSILGMTERDLKLPTAGLAEVSRSIKIEHHTMTRLHGRMDTLCNTRREGAKLGAKDGAKYMIGRVGPLNFVANYLQRDRFTPGYKPET